MIGETGERKSALATPDGKSRKKKKNVSLKICSTFSENVSKFDPGSLRVLLDSDWVRDNNNFLCGMLRLRPMGFSKARGKLREWGSRY